MMNFKEFLLTEDTFRRIKISINKSDGIVHWRLLASFSKSVKEPYWSKYRMVFEIKDDELMLTNLEDSIRECVETHKPTGFLGTELSSSDWYISYKDLSDLRYSNVDIEDEIEFKVFNNVTEIGFRFDLDVSRAKEFADFIKDINML